MVACGVIGFMSTAHASPVAGQKVMTSWASDAALSPAALRRMIPTLKQPRLLSRLDVSGKEKIKAFDDYEYVFAVRGDFNRDGAPDIAFAGIDEGGVFVAIVTKKGTRWKPDFFYRPNSDFAGLKVFLHVELAGQDGTPLPLHPRTVEIAVVAYFTVFGGGDYVVLYWDESRYRTVTGFEMGD